MTRKSTPHVVALCGSLRDESRTNVALESLLATARETGATTELVDLRSYELPSLHAVESEPPDADRLRATIADADSVALGTPNYHGSYAGSLKNALDYCRREEFAGTTVGLLEVAGGEFPGSAIDHLRTVSRTLHAWPLPTDLPSRTPTRRLPTRESPTKRSLNGFASSAATSSRTPAWRPIPRRSLEADD
ncbi:flavoprotein [Natrinema sp. J7-2]|nr:NAD(P)H-dependent oxidoreductase [Natrinema sp. J7-2]AFO58791.1 flavoprotein [Natrinema sp. J7-2]